MVHSKQIFILAAMLIVLLAAVANAGTQTNRQPVAQLDSSDSANYITAADGDDATNTEPDTTTIERSKRSRTVA